ncbi:MAG: MFS transporter [Halioglobus sp.]
MTMPKEKLNERESTSLAYAWVVVGLLMIAYTLSFLDRQILALLVTDIQRDLQVSDTQIGLLQGLAFTIFYTTLGIPIARLADYRNRRNLISVGILLWSVMTMLCGYTRSFFSLFLVRMGVGVGEAALSPAAYSIITDYFPREHLSKALSVYAMGVYIGGGIAFLMGGYLVSALSATDFSSVPILANLAGWQLAFVFAGLPGIFVAAIIYLFVREPSRRFLQQSSVPDTGGTIRDAVKYLSDHRRAYLPIYAGFSIHAVAVFAIFAWLPTQLIREFDFSVSDAGKLVGMCILLAGCAGAMAGGVICDRLLKGGRYDAPLILGLISAVGTSLPFFVANFWEVPMWLRTCLIGSSFFFMALIAGPAPAAIQFIAPQHLRAQLSAVFLFSINFIGMTLGPLLPAMLSDSLFTGAGGIGQAMTYVILIAGVVSMFIFAAFRSDYKSLARASRAQN